MFNVIGVIYMLPLVWTGLFGKAVSFITPWELSQNTIMVHIAVAHSMFNVTNAIVFTVAIRWLEAIVMKILPVTKRELAERPVVLEKHLFTTPIIALEQTKREIIRMAGGARSAVQGAIEGLIEGDDRKLNKAMTEEDIIDAFQLDITSYLTALSREQLSDVVSNKLPVLLHTVNDLERIGDHAVNIVEIARRKMEQNLQFSDSALDEAAQLRKEMDEMFDYIKEALEDDSAESARKALLNENNLNRMQLEFRRSHVQRMGEGLCPPEAGLIFCDLVDNIEKIGDHLTNIAQAVIGGLQWAGVEPEIAPNSTD